MKYSTSAPGKIILSGEHSVVYGYDALVASLEKRTIVDIELYTDYSLSSTCSSYLSVVTSFGEHHFTQNWNQSQIEQLHENPHLIDTLIDSSLLPLHQTAFKVFLTMWHRFLNPLKLDAFEKIQIKITSHLPIGAGLGSSASLCVALAGTIYQINTQSDIADKDLINEWALEGERIVHGTPSGIDNTISVYGGALLYNKNKKLNFEDSIVLSPALPQCLIINTKLPRSTKTMVNRVKERYEKYPEVIKPIFESLGKLPQLLIDLFTSSSFDSVSLETLFEINQNLLNSIGCGHSFIDQILVITRQNKCWAKLTGAGGGGCLVGFLTEQTNVKQLFLQLDQLNVEYFITCIGGRGIEFHSQG